MGDNYKATPLYIWVRRCFWLLFLVYLPSYCMTRYKNEETRFGPQFQILNTLWFIPTHRVTWESYLMTLDQVRTFLIKDISPKKILRNSFSVDPNGNYYIVFRLKTNQHDIVCASIKCYVEGAQFPINFDVYPGENWEVLGPPKKQGFKDYIVPVHIDPNKVKLVPRLSIQWTSMLRG